MDRDFQARYQQAERAYGEGSYSDAHAMASDLLSELESTAHDDGTASAWFGWRSVVALLLGHIALHGLHQPKEAADFYALVLDSQPPEIQAQLAEQGLAFAHQASLAAEMPEPEPVHSAMATLELNTPRDASPSTDLLKDPFLLEDTQRSKPTTNAPRSTAMPWLEEAIAPTPKLESKDLETPAQGSEVSQDQANQPLVIPPQHGHNEDAKPEEDKALLEFTEDTQTSQQDPMDLLRDSWIRITVDPSLLDTTKGEAKSPPSWRLRLSRLFRRSNRR